MNYAPSTPLREGIRSYFANDIVGAVGIGVDESPVFGPVQPALHPPATEGGRGQRRIEDRQRVRIEEAGLARVALLRDVHLDAHQCGLVGQHVDETRMGHGTKVWLVRLPMR